MSNRQKGCGQPDARNIDWRSDREQKQCGKELWIQTENIIGVLAEHSSMLLDESSAVMTSLRLLSRTQQADDNVLLQDRSQTTSPPPSHEERVQHRTTQQWDINDSSLPRLEKLDKFQVWPNGHCCYVYNPELEDSRRHVSGWAMRNTNNHNALILKKSCLGVLVCNLDCMLENGDKVHLRPAICDKARRKQIGKRCSNANCNGRLELMACRGHCGYPVTHFWRHCNGGVYFQAKGYHDHPRPEVKAVAESRRHVSGTRHCRNTGVLDSIIDDRKRHAVEQYYEVDNKKQAFSSSGTDAMCSCPPFECTCSKSRSYKGFLPTCDIFNDSFQSPACVTQININNSSQPNGPFRNPGSHFIPDDSRHFAHTSAPSISVSCSSSQGAASHHLGLNALFDPPFRQRDDSVFLKQNNTEGKSMLEMGDSLADSRNIAFIPSQHDHPVCGYTRFDDFLSAESSRTSSQWIKTETPVENSSLWSSRSKLSTSNDFFPESCTSPVKLDSRSSSDYSFLQCAEKLLSLHCSDQSKVDRSNTTPEHSASVPSQNQYGHQTYNVPVTPPGKLEELKPVQQHFHSNEQPKTAFDVLQTNVNSTKEGDGLWNRFREHNHTSTINSTNSFQSSGSYRQSPSLENCQSSAYTQCDISRYAHYYGDCQQRQVPQQFPAPTKQQLCNHSINITLTYK